MIWWLAFEKKPFQFWREIWIQVVVILLQLYNEPFFLLSGFRNYFNFRRNFLLTANLVHKSFDDMSQNSLWLHRITFQAYLISIIIIKQESTSAKKRSFATLPFTQWKVSQAFAYLPFLNAGTKYKYFRHEWESTTCFGVSWSSQKCIFSKVCWHRPAMFCHYTSSKLSCP